ncbi:MAG: hypothetical protein RMJ97_11755 [Raineya sp.]|nr:GNAT family N-acetyltransferase [Raineya sp.]MDW8297547.1 hypothetical protein [Raineya sp.]
MIVNKNVAFKALPLDEFTEIHLLPFFEPFLFNTNKHLPLQKNSTIWVFWGEEKQKIKIRCNVFVQDNEGFSPWRMSFGGIEFDEKISYESLNNFVEFVCDFCKNELKLKKLLIKQYPFSYAEENSHQITQILLRQGFTIINQELTHYIRVQENFEANLHNSAKRRLAKAIQAGFIFEEWQKPDWQEVFNFVAKARQRKNFPLTMTWQDFQETVNLFPDEYLALVVRKNQEIAALTVGVVVSSKIFYNFYPADNPKFLQYSPMILLTQGLIQFCRKQHFEILDLGISTENGKPNFGLIRFKKNLGAKSALKLSFEKQFN